MEKQVVGGGSALRPLALAGRNKVYWQRVERPSMARLLEGHNTFLLRFAIPLVAPPPLLRGSPGGMSPGRRLDGRGLTATACRPLLC